MPLDPAAAAAPMALEPARLPRPRPAGF
jgi:hypothetical protein